MTRWTFVRTGVGFGFSPVCVLPAAQHNILLSVRRAYRVREIGFEESINRVGPGRNTKRSRDINEKIKNIPNSLTLS